MSPIDQHDRGEKQEMEAVSRAYRAARDGGDGMLPPAALDDAIRAAARRAVRAGPQPVGKSWLRRWTPSLAVAAVVVLSVSVVFVAIEEQPELAPAPIQKITQARRAEAPAAEITSLQENAVAAQSAPVAASAGAKKKAAIEPEKFAADTVASVARQAPSETAKEVRVAQSTAPVPPPQVASAASKLAAPVFAPPPAAAVIATPAITPPNASRPQAPAATPFPAAAEDAISPAQKPARVEARVDARATTAERNVAEEKVVVSGALRSRLSADAPAKRELAASTAVAASAAPVAPAAPVTPAAPVPKADAPLLKNLQPKTDSTPTQIAGAGAAPVEAALSDSLRRNAQSAGVRGMTTEKDDAGSAADDERPGPWIKRMQALHEQGKLKELRVEIPRFKKRHPSVVLPKSLSELPAE